MQDKVKKKKPGPPGRETEWQRIDYFFELFDKEGGREELWRLLKLALCANNDLTTARDRTNMIFFYKQATVLIEAVYTLLQNKKP